MARELPNIDILRSLVSFNPETGELHWKPRGEKSWDPQNAGKRAFKRIRSEGYFSGTLLGYPIDAHRVAWAVFHGAWAKNQIDHINGDKLDNRIINLREVSVKENHRNMPAPSTNTSGCVGVYWHKNKRRWNASIKVDGKLIHIGNYLEKVDAIHARKQAEVQYGFHANHGRL